MIKATVVVMIEAEGIIQTNRRTKVVEVHLTAISPVVGQLVELASPLPGLIRLRLLVRSRVVSLTRLLARPQRVLAVPQVRNPCALRLLLQV